MKRLMLVLALFYAGAIESAEIQKVLFLGNSITLHGPSKKIDWSGNWGMAASSADMDYVHRVAAALARKDGAAPATMVRNIAAFERQYGAFDAAALVKDASAFEADLIVVAIGENVPALTNAACKAEFAGKTSALLKAVKGGKQPMVVVRSCFWANAAKDGALKQACDEVGGVFVDIGALGKDEKNFARSERPYKHAGVANHPGDRGMQAIADAIVGAVKGK